MGSCYQRVGYLYNFCNYVRWPNPVTPEAFTVGVLGPALQTPDAVAMIRELNGQSVANRTIVLREFATVEKYQPRQIKGSRLFECSLALARAERATQITNGLVVVLGATCSSAIGRI